MPPIIVTLQQLRLLLQQRMDAFNGTLTFRCKHTLYLSIPLTGSQGEQAQVCRRPYTPTNPPFYLDSFLLDVG